MSFDDYIQLHSHHHNQDMEQFQHSPSATL